MKKNLNDFTQYNKKKSYFIIKYNCYSIYYINCKYLEFRKTHYILIL